MFMYLPLLTPCHGWILILIIWSKKIHDELNMRHESGSKLRLLYLRQLMTIGESAVYDISRHPSRELLGILHLKILFLHVLFLAMFSYNVMKQIILACYTCMNKCNRYCFPSCAPTKGQSGGGAIVWVCMTNNVGGCIKNHDKGEAGGGRKYPQNRMTSFMDDLK